MGTKVMQFGSEPDPLVRLRHRQGAAIKTARRMRGMTGTALAEAIGRTQGAVSQYESGRVTPPQDVQIAIARVLDVPWSLLFSVDEVA